MRALDSYNLFLPTGDAKFGNLDYAIDSNSMYALVDRMGDIPLHTRSGNAAYLRDVATPSDANFIQTNIVRVNGRRQVYIPVFRQLGSSTLSVVDGLKKAVPEMQPRLTRPDVNLKVVMDQSVYVRQSIKSLAEEGLIGAVLCSLVILVFLGQWRMTVIAVLTLPIATLGAIVCLYYTGNTLNVMTLAGMSLAIGPMIDTAIISLENTHRHLESGSHRGGSGLSRQQRSGPAGIGGEARTLLVLAPLAIMPGQGQFLFSPMALGRHFLDVGGIFAVPFLRSLPLRPWLQPAPQSPRRRTRRGLGATGAVRSSSRRKAG